MMKFAKSSLFILITLFTSWLTSCATATDPAETYKGESAEHIFQQGEDALSKRGYQEALKRFEALDVQYPFSPHIEVADLHIIYAYYMTSDYASTQAAADRFIHTHPSSPHVDYAYYMRGLANYYQNLGIFERLFTVDLATRDLTQIKKSYADFAMIVKTYPHSEYAPAAHQYTIYLRDTLAAHELEVAQFYYKRKAYVASANRANMLIRYYEGTPYIEKALVLMVKDYQNLHLTAAANDALKVLRYNYPQNTELAQKP
jgi:outer membrane protein assembly factor BamD